MTDPDRTLSRIRDILAGTHPGLHDGMELADLVSALDGHLSDGGWPPADWIGPDGDGTAARVARHDRQRMAARAGRAHQPLPPRQIRHPGGKDGWWRVDCSCGRYSSQGPTLERATDPVRQHAKGVGGSQ